MASPRATRHRVRRGLRSRPVGIRAIGVRAPTGRQRPPGANPGRSGPPPRHRPAGSGATRRAWLRPGSRGRERRGPLRRQGRKRPWTGPPRAARLQHHRRLLRRLAWVLRVRRLPGIRTLRHGASLVPGARGIRPGLMPGRAGPATDESRSDREDRGARTRQRWGPPTDRRRHQRQRARLHRRRLLHRRQGRLQRLRRRFHLLRCRCHRRRIRLHGRRAWTLGYRMLRLPGQPDLPGPADRADLANPPDLPTPRGPPAGRGPVRVVRRRVRCVSDPPSNRRSVRIRSAPGTLQGLRSLRGRGRRIGPARRPLHPTRGALWMRRGAGGVVLLGQASGLSTAVRRGGRGRCRHLGLRSFRSGDPGAREHRDPRTSRPCGRTTSRFGDPGCHRSRRRRRHRWGRWGPWRDWSSRVPSTSRVPTTPGPPSTPTMPARPITGGGPTPPDPPTMPGGGPTAGGRLRLPRPRWPRSTRSGPGPARWRDRLEPREPGSRGAGG
jgi:hypothetical protein